jgi:predicted alpha-1,2-mannosidase
MRQKAAKHSGDILSYVDPFIGVDGCGNCLCGPYLPLSLVRLGPDTLIPHSTNGYDGHRPIIRFSHTHVSGTGGGGRYGNIGITPFVGLARTSPVAFGQEDEIAEPGYYGVRLQPSGVQAELTATPRVGVHRYTFPEETEANLLIDVGAVIQTTDARHTPGVNTGASIGGWIAVVSDHEVIGRGDFRGGWGHDAPYSVYFSATFDSPASQIQVANTLGLLPKQMADGPNCLAVISFGPVEQVNLKVGISFVSIAKARASIARETDGKDFETLRAQAAAIWRQALSRIRVEGGTEEQFTLFYTLFTRLLCMPSDLGIDDENPLWESGIRHFTDYYALWDSVRNANSLISLFDPELEAAMLNCLLDIADHIGWLPDAWIAGHSAMIQGGNAADILFCEAALKDLPGIDYAKALRYTRKNAEVESPDPWYYGRYVKDYRALGYLPLGIPQCVSRHLEYAYQDWCIGTLAAHLGEQAVAQDYRKRSKQVWNLWRQDLLCFAPKTPDGQWVTPFDPARFASTNISADPYFYEATGRQWAFHVLHDMAGLIARHGGNEGFVRHLDEFFDEGYYSSKETMLHIPYLYIYAGRPDKTAERVRASLEKYFHPTRNGLSDNEDMGCQSAWYMCSTMGIYPIMGQDIYLLSSPLFKRTEMMLGTSGNRLVIEAPEAGPDKPYVQSATLNGKPLDRAWLTHHEIAHGATLHFELANSPGEWGTKELPHMR